MARAYSDLSSWRNIYEGDSLGCDYLVDLYVSKEEDEVQSSSEVQVEPPIKGQTDAVESEKDKCVVNSETDESDFQIKKDDKTNN